MLETLIKVLHTVSSRLANTQNEEKVYQIMYEGISAILPDIYFIITKIHPGESSFTITHMYGFEKYMDEIKILVGKDPLKRSYSINELSDNQLEIFENGRLHKFSNGLNGIENEKLSKTICKTIERLLNISGVYAIGLSLNKQYFGSANLLTKKSNKPVAKLNKKHQFAIESIAFQVSFAIKKIRDLEELENKEKELVVTQSHYTQLVNQLNDVVWKANGDGTGLVDMGNTFSKVYGYASAAFESNPNLGIDIVHREDKKIMLDALTELYENGNAVAEYRIVKPNGSVVWLNDRRSVVYDQYRNPVQMGGLATDITEKKKIEASLREKEQALQTLNQEKDKFLSIVAHDLKSPFNGMLGFFDLLAKEYHTFDDDERLRIIRSSLEAAQKAYGLLSDLLEWASFQHRKILHKVPVDLHYVMDEVIELNMNSIINKQLTIKNNIQLKEKIPLDLNSLHTLCRNIFSNAIKFTPKDGTIEVNVRKVENGIELSFKDSGIGMSNEMIRDAFRLDKSISRSGTGNEQGTGLGLIICKGIADNNKWEMNFESEPEKGTTVSVLLN